MKYHGKKAGPFTTLFIGVVFIIIGYIVTFEFGLPILKDAKESVEWPNTSGTIIHSQLVKSRSKKKKTSYSASIEYTYTVNNENYVGSTISFGTDNMSSSNASSATSRVKKYKEGSTIDIYFSPDTPEKSVLEPGATWESYFLAVLGSVFLVIGLLITSIAMLKTLIFTAALTYLLGTLFTKKQKSPKNSTGKEYGFSPKNHQSDKSNSHSNDGIDTNW